MAEPRFSELIAGYSFLEGPRWHDGRLWLSDFYTQRVIAVGLDGRAETIAAVPQQPSGLGWLPDGRLLVVSMRDRRVLRREADGRLVQHADLSGVAGGHANDMVVDGQGRAYVGNFGFDLMGGGTPALARLARVDPDGTVSVAAEGLHFPNGAMLTPDGRTLVVCETMGNRISAFDVQADGGLGPRRDWAVWGPQPSMTDVPTVLGSLKAAPDGAVLDAEGAVWFADAVGHRAVRMAPGGEILQSIPTGNMGCFALTLGGPDRRTLFLCVAPDFHEAARQAAREAAVWATPVDVPGAGTP
ncbi:SMP-30/gluconolactonase/LRE family protein [Pseudorhodoferax sp. Leaf265]|uniref:SMP-30/gluconolactonase/LRE family protein n=1 Tax=Pseudorhodoferax sp. Leaf265 TaxID=1736315 RepID=UPI0006F88B89|nr:SMP-30/gluconolactonase/LRE family protein [Pseudorhodoferax sp. Leaf265]KQP02938.1 gluconolactonase [Pseudorhodoferax sp. Leaf265]PZP97820.1 MAG: gluconolactonase [Variovorax paradoxus]PZQ09114.1 MAG: gluconolactonase [Variovorax paradoxus]